MLPVWNSYGQWPASGEIDIVESRGNYCVKIVLDMVIYLFQTTKNEIAQVINKFTLKI